VNTSAVTPDAFKYSRCKSFNGLAGQRCFPMVMTGITVNLAVIIKAVGFFVRRRSRPGEVRSSNSIYRRMERSVKRQINRETRSARAATSILSAFLRKMLFAIAGPLMKLKFLLMPIRLLYSFNSSEAGQSSFRRDKRINNY